MTTHAYKSNKTGTFLVSWFTAITLKFVMDGILLQIQLVSNNHISCLKNLINFWNHNLMAIIYYGRLNTYLQIMCMIQYHQDCMQIVIFWVVLRNPVWQLLERSRNFSDGQSNYHNIFYYSITYNSIVKISFSDRYYFNKLCY